MSAQAAFTTSAATAPLAVISDDAGELAQIYQAEVNLVVWQQALCGCLGRQAALQLQEDIQRLLVQQPGFRFSLIASREGARQRLQDTLPSVAGECAGLAAWLLTALDLFVELFEPAAVALRLQSLQTAMCPRFHVDHVPVRLVSTLTGAATEWLPETALARSALGASGHNPCLDQAAIQRMESGDLALLKGEGWMGNEGRGLVHRSPQVSGQPRLFLSIDFANAL